MPDNNWDDETLRMISAIRDQSRALLRRVTLKARAMKRNRNDSWEWFSEEVTSALSLLRHDPAIEELIYHPDQSAMRIIRSASEYLKKSPWKPIAEAPRDGTTITVLFANGDEDEVCWEEDRYCMIGSPQGSYGPGWVDKLNHLPVMDDFPITHFKEITKES